LESEKKRLDEAAERGRAVASRREPCLREHQTVPLEVYQAYLDIEGPRDWSEEAQSAPQ